MLSEEQIRDALHASRVVPLFVSNPHGPLGLEQLAAAVGRLRDEQHTPAEEARVRLPIAVSPQTWDKLVQLAEATSQQSASRVNASALAAAIIEEFVATAETGPRRS